MRFLLTVGLLGIAGVSGVCQVKTSSPNSNIGLCALADTPTVELIQNGAVSIPVPQWDPADYPPGAVLDAVYINGIGADYNPVASYKFGGNNKGYIDLSIPNVWNFYSEVDNFVVGTDALGSLTGFGTVNPSVSGSNLIGCILRTNTKCKSGMNILQKAFTIKDHTYENTQYNGAIGVDVPFTPDYTQALTFTDFVSDDPTSSNGVLIAATNTGGIPAGYVGTGDWNLITSRNDGIAPTTVDGGFFQQSNGPAIQVTVTHHLTVSLEIQYDYHLPQVSGDPQFAGFQGQSFQVHGAPDAYFALISAPSYYVNARFDYISTGSCTYNDTACFTHPGTYMGMIFVGMRDANILIQAGPHSTGFAGVLVNDKPMTSGDRLALTGVSADSYIQVVSQSKLILALDNIMITVHNSDLFVNFDLALTDKELLASGSIRHTIPSGSTPSQVQHHLNKWYGAFNPLHGLIGQTWRNVKYQDNKLYQGDITEYQLDKIVDHTFLYCVYQA